MLLGRAALNATKEDKQKKMDAQGFEDNHAYLRSKLKYDNNKVEGLLLDDKEDAVMMSWETKLMEEHARLICHNKGSVLNVGHGMGIVDGKIQVKIMIKIESNPFAECDQLVVLLIVPKNS